MSQRSMMFALVSAIILAVIFALIAERLPGWQRAWDDRDEFNLDTIPMMTPSEQDKSRRSCRHRFLLVLPYEGLSNQLNGIVRGLELARLLGRTLIVPPLVRSQHENPACPELEDWRTYLDLDDLFSGQKVLFLHDMGGEAHGIIPCYSFGRWRTWHQYGQTTRTFLRRVTGTLHFGLRWRPVKAPAALHLLTSIMSATPDLIIAIAQLQHVHFPPHVRDRVAKMRFTDHVLRSLPPLSGGYIGLHWRRGDFSEACRNKNVSSCYPSVSALAPLMWGGPFKVVWVATDEPSSMLSLREAFPNQEFMRGDAGCAALYFMDLAMLLNSTHFVGNPYSTLSRNIFTHRQHLDLPSTAF